MSKDLKKKLKDLKRVNKEMNNEYYNINELEKKYGIPKEKLKEILRIKEYFESIKDFN